MRGAPTGGPGGVVGEVDDGGEEEEDGRDTEDYQVGVDVLSELLSGLTAHICTDALNLQSNTSHPRFTRRHYYGWILIC